MTDKPVSEMTEAGKGAAVQQLPGVPHRAANSGGACLR